MRAHRAALLALPVILAPWLVQAQTTAATFHDLQPLVKAGDSLTVSDDTGATMTGVLSELTATTLVLRVGPDVRRFAESEVTRIRQKRRDSLLNGALFGGLVGGAVGLMGENACGNDFGCSSAKGASLALGLGLGIAGGVGVDALIVRERTIYDRRPTRGASLGVAPLVGRGTQGAVVSLRF